MKNNSYRSLIIRFLFTGFAVVFADWTSEGISYGNNFYVLFVSVLILSFFNIILKPLLMLFALPFILLTLGFGIWIINALLFMFVGFLVPNFEVVSFWSALWGSFCVSVMGMLTNLFTRDGVIGKGINIKMHTHRNAQKGNFLPKKHDEDVIDI
jgi:putative membrane protein